MLAYVRMFVWRRKTDTNNAKAPSHMRAHICNVQNKRLLCFVTGLLAVRLMKQTSRIIELERTTVVVEAPKGRKPKEVEANEFE